MARSLCTNSRSPWTRVQLSTTDPVLSVIAMEACSGAYLRSVPDPMQTYPVDIFATEPGSGRKSSTAMVTFIPSGE